ncbi:MAG: hypothetical protein NTW17_01025 [Candidatus Pacearchaeota archaeon]|nr:hypothetical protein [Candidatus Pacearchaeota archaeon]
MGNDCQITKQRLKSAIEDILRVLQKSGLKADTTIIVEVGERNEDRLVFFDKDKETRQEVRRGISPLSRRIGVRYLSLSNDYPILEAEVIVSGVQSNTSRLSFLCLEGISGYTIEDTDKQDNIIQYRFFSNYQRGKDNGFRKQLICLSNRLKS